MVPTVVGGVEGVAECGDPPGCPFISLGSTKVNTPFFSFFSLPPGISPNTTTIPTHRSCSYNLGIRGLIKYSFINEQNHKENQIYNCFRCAYIRSCIQSLVFLMLCLCVHSCLFNMFYSFNILFLTSFYLFLNPSSLNIFLSLILSIPISFQLNFSSSCLNCPFSSAPPALSSD